MSGPEGGLLLPGNTGGAWRVGERLHRTGGPWTPAVHGLLRTLEQAPLPCVPRVHGRDAAGREVLDFLPGEVPAETGRPLSDDELADLVAWTARLHDLTRGMPRTGLWRFPGPRQGPAEVIGHNDLSPSNVCFSGGRIAGVFDWDLAGPTTPLLELGFVAWHHAPLLAPAPATAVADRLRLIVDAYGDPAIAPDHLVTAASERMALAAEGIEAAAAAGDEGMRLLIARTGEPARIRARLAQLAAAPGDEPRPGGAGR